MKIYISEKLAHFFQSEKYQIYENKNNINNEMDGTALENQEIAVLNIQDNLIYLEFLNTNFKPFYIDFFDSKWNFRYKEQLLFKELLIKALGIKKNEKVSILDCYAGLGRDGFIMAMTQCEVISLEKSPILFMLLKNAIERLKSKLAIDWELHFISNLSYLESNQKKLDIIYLDPMFPERNKTAKVKKEAQILQFLGAHDEVEDHLLLTRALTLAQRRVIVKRSLHSLPLSQMRPSFGIKGKTIRYDVYLTNIY